MVEINPNIEDITINTYNLSCPAKAGIERLNLYFKHLGK